MKEAESDQSSSNCERNRRWKVKQPDCGTKVEIGIGMCRDHHVPLVSSHQLGCPMGANGKSATAKLDPRRGCLSRARGQAATAKFNRHLNGDVLQVGASKVSGWCQWKFFNCHIEAMGVGGNVQVEPVEKLQLPYSTAILDGRALVGISDWRQ
ncbi:hypothetical protein IV203_030169 [Nitzschia inconspicua]|uniref:Uncharacterized protein n=1 Tax=Nitzschia inconspicua TaxID=303405 RepID=A0A9K3Q1F8_9STRA|nr:hypothetical protein IV203_030169 [Nitzschia inconspicua]